MDWFLSNAAAAERATAWNFSAMQSFRNVSMIKMLMLSRDSLLAQQIAVSLRVQVDDGGVDGGTQGVLRVLSARRQWRFPRHAPTPPANQCKHGITASTRCDKRYP
jgi:hypothetical protein